MAPYQLDGLADGALATARTLFPGASVAAALLANGKSLHLVGTRGPHGYVLLDGIALQAAYRTMSERTTIVQPCEDGELAGHTLISAAIPGEGGAPSGVLLLLTPGVPEATAPKTVEALGLVIADAARRIRLNRELQHSLNQLFLVHQVGREFNLASSLDEVLRAVSTQLAGTLNVHHCCILLLHERRYLVPEAGIGIDREWMEQERLVLARTLANSVLESGVAEQICDPVEMATLDAPLLDNGVPPASILSAPLITRTGILGFLELYTATPYAFSRDEVFLLSMLAGEVAVAVENAQLYAAVREKEGRLTVLAHKLIHSQEEERRRIARDMHDGLAQMIVSAFQYLQAHAFTVQDGTDRQALDRGLTMLAECIDESRKVIFNLRPSTLDDFGLVLALRQYLSALETEFGWQVEFALAGHVGPLPSTLETAIFRLVQEALTNARKHARTQRVRVKLAAKDGELTISVRDWGQGFDMREAAARRRGQLGLMGMKERVQLLNGSFHLRSKPGAGTLVRITLPTT